MDDQDRIGQWRRDAEVLGDIGPHLAGQRLPRRPSGELSRQPRSRIVPKKRVIAVASLTAVLALGVSWPSF